MKNKILSVPCVNPCSDSYRSCGKILTVQKSLNRYSESFRNNEHANSAIREGILCVPCGKKPNREGHNKVKEKPIFSFTESKYFLLSASK